MANYQDYLQKKRPKNAAAYSNAIGGAGVDGIASAVATELGVRPKIAGVDAATSAADAAQASTAAPDAPPFRGETQRILPSDATIPAKPVTDLAELGVVPGRNAPAPAEQKAVARVGGPAAAPVASPVVKEKPVVATGAEDAANNAPTLGVRKIGQSTYTNDPNQQGGAELGASGNLSISGDQRTAGMTQAQAAEYWTAQMAQQEAASRTRELQRRLDDATPSANDSIGELLSKAGARRSLSQQLNLGVKQQDEAAGNVGRIVAGNGPEANRLRELEAEGVELGVKAKRREEGVKKQLSGLLAQYQATKDPSERARLANDINVLQGNDIQDKYTPLMSKDDLGNPVYLGAFSTKTGELVNGQRGEGTAPAAAIAYLKQHPEQAEAFKAKYGYLPA